MITLMSFPPAFKASSRAVKSFLASNLVFVFGVVPSVSKYQRLFIFFFVTDQL